MKYKHLLFDADGTLFDYDKSEENALRESFNLKGNLFRDEYLNEYRKINQRLWLDFEKGLIDSAVIKERRFEQLFDVLNINDNVSLFSEIYVDNLSRQTILLDHAEELIKSLWKKYTLTIITNGLAFVQRRRLENSNLYEFIDHIIISEEINSVKPSFEYFDFVYKSLGKPDKREILIIGDSLTSDILGGINFGLDTCWFNPLRKAYDPGIKATYEIYNLSELAPVLENHH